MENQRVVQMSKKSQNTSLNWGIRGCLGEESHAARIGTRVLGQVSPKKGREELGPPATALSDEHDLALVVLIVADGVDGWPVSKQPER